MADATVTLEVEAGNISSKLIREMAKTERSFMQTVKSAVSKGTSAGVSESGLDKAFTTAIDKAGKHMASAAKLFERAQQTSDMKAKKALLERAGLQRKAAESVFDRETKHTKATIDRRWKAHKKSEAFLSKSHSERAKGLADGFSKLRGGDAKGAGGAASGAAKIGAGLLGRGAAAAGGAAASGSGAGGAAMGAAATAMSGAATTLAAAAIPIALIAGTLAVVVKLMIDANAQAKELNKAFLDSAGAGDMMFTVMNDGSEQLQSGLQGLRAAATDFVHNVRWGTVAEDMVKILASANAAGLTYKEMAADTGDLVNGMKGYLGVTELALRYSKLLGVDASELAGNIGEWSSDLGMGLKQLEESFSTVTKLAMESGFGVKRFYSMVQQATSGLGLYNNRIGETAKLLATTGDILGEQEAKDFLSTLQKGFSEDDYNARLKRVLLTGPKKIHKVLSSQAVSTAEAYAGNFAQPLAESLDAVLKGSGMEGMGIDLAFGDPAALADALGAMTGAQQSELLGILSAKDNAAGKQMKGLIDLSKAKVGGADDTSSLIKALGAVSPSGKLALLLDAQVLGTKTIADMSAMERKIFGDNQDLSVIQVEHLERLQATLLGQKRAAERGNEVVIRKLGLLSEGFDTLDPAAQEAELASIAKEMKDTDTADYFRKFGAAEEEVATALSQQEALALSTVNNTRDMSSILKNGIQFALEKIYVLMSDAIGTIFGMGKVERAAKAKAEEEMRKSLGLLSQGVSAQATTVADAQRAVDTAKTVGEKSDAEKKLVVEQEKLKKLESKRGLEQSASASLITMGSGKFSRDLSARDTQGFLEGSRAAAAGRNPDAVRGVLGEEGYSDAVEKGRARQAGKGGGLQGAITSAAPGVSQGLWDTAFEAPNKKDLMTGGTHRLPALGGSMMAGMFGAAGEAGQEMEGAEAVGEALSASTEATTAAIEVTAAEAKAMQAESDRKAEKLSDEQKSEAERLRKEFPSLTAQGAIEADAARVLQTAGMKYSPENISKLLGQKGSDAAADIRAEATRKAGAGAFSEDQMRQFKIGTPADDFIYQGGGNGGVVTPIDRADQLLGAKPGGAFDLAGGGGGSNIVNITINGGDQAKVYETVKRALRASGVR